MIAPGHSSPCIPRPQKKRKNMADHWQKDADGILIFVGPRGQNFLCNQEQTSLFSAAVAALLAVTLQSLIPNSQDTSSFYLGNIYGILADSNAARTRTPSPVATPPLFSPPRYAIWVNSLWSLSLLISLTCALWAPSSQQWVRRYIRVTQGAGRSPEKHAWMRAFYAMAWRDYQLYCISPCSFSLRGQLAFCSIPTTRSFTL